MKDGSPRSGRRYRAAVAAGPRGWNKDENEVVLMAISGCPIPTPLASRLFLPNLCSLLSFRNERLASLLRTIIRLLVHCRVLSEGPYRTAEIRKRVLRLQNVTQSLRRLAVRLPSSFSFAIAKG